MVVYLILCRIKHNPNHICYYIYFLNENDIKFILKFLFKLQITYKETVDKYNLSVQLNLMIIQTLTKRIFNAIKIVNDKHRTPIYSIHIFYLLLNTYLHYNNIQYICSV